MQGILTVIEKKSEAKTYYFPASVISIFLIISMWLEYNGAWKLGYAGFRILVLNKIDHREYITLLVD